MSHVTDLPAALAAYLMASGTLGRKEAEIRKRFSHVPRERILLELETLWKMKRVQRFTMDKKYIWRATEEMNV